jgi:hypothetical protein
MRLALPWHAEPPSPPPPEASHYEQASLALEHVVERLSRAPKCGVVDLGSPTAANLELYARHRARITFADLHRFYAPRRLAGADSERFNESLPKTPIQVDVILAWDLLDYLSLEEMHWLRAALSRHCAPGSLLHALVSSGGLIPETPSFYTVVDDATLLVQESGPPVRPSPAHSEPALLHALNGVTVRKRFQLRRAAVEYLFDWT